MKVILVLASLLAAVIGFELPHDEGLELRRIHQNCRQETSCHNDYLRNPNQYRGEPSLGKQLYCISKDYGVLSEEGGLDYDLLRNKLSVACSPDEDPDYYLKLCLDNDSERYIGVVNFWSCLEDHGFKYLTHMTSPQYE